MWRYGRGLYELPTSRKYAGRMPNMILTKRQKEVMLELRKGRKMTFHGYASSPPAVTWDDESWTPHLKNYVIVFRSLLKKQLVWLDDTTTFHVCNVLLTE